MKKFLVATIFFLLLLPLSTTKASGSIVINEIAWMGTVASVNDEWMELHNRTDGLISLDGWLLMAEDGTPEIKLSGTIPAKGFFLLERTDDSTLPSVSADLIYKGALGNNGERLKLYDATGELVDETGSSSGWSAGDNSTKQTMERKEDDTWQNSYDPGGTPRAQNSVVLTEILKLPEDKPVEDGPLTYSGGIVFNEIMPSPEGPDEAEEWIEIFNQNDFQVNLSDWKIEDTTGRITTYFFPKNAEISAKNFLVLPREETGITLNNSEDGLNIFQPNGNITDSVSYKKAPRGQSYNRFGAEWAWNTLLTPGATNAGLPRSEEIRNPETDDALFSNPDKEDKTDNNLAAIGKYLPENSSAKTIFLTAAGLAIFCTMLFIFLKKKIRIN